MTKGESKMKVLIIESDLRLCRHWVSRLRSERVDAEIHQTSELRGAFGAFQQLKPEVVLLDLQIGHGRGLELCRRIADWSERTAVVVIGSKASDACAALDAGAVDFLVRPLEYERLEQALDKAAHLSAGLRTERLRVAETESPFEFVASRLHGELKIIPIREIRCFRAEDKYVTAVHRHGEDLIDEPLWRLEERFGAHHFVRVHRNGLVARQAIRSRRSSGRHRHTVTLHDGQEMPVSRRHVAPLRRLLLDRLNGG